MKIYHVTLKDQKFTKEIKNIIKEYDIRTYDHILYCFDLRLLHKDHRAKIIAFLSDELMSKGFGKNDEPNSYGLIVEDYISFMNSEIFDVIKAELSLDSKSKFVFPEWPGAYSLWKSKGNQLQECLYSNTTDNFNATINDLIKANHESQSVQFIIGEKIKENFKVDDLIKEHFVCSTDKIF